MTEDDGRLDELVAECVLALEDGDETRIAAIRAAHPDLATALDERLAQLGRMGLLHAQADADDLPPTPAAFRIVELIGRGGMGAVYRAEQRTPVRRPVAFKVIKRGMDSAAVVARFAAEQQALALMNHDNIARVFEAGTLPDGRPYFAMELVEGETITRHARTLTTDARLQLFAVVCDAVQHAHHKGVIHRDLKPSNILVERRGDRSIPKIIDFGVAKAISGRLGEETLHTEHGQLLGTPEYMSPEQATDGVIDVDTRSDVYSLGVLLFELLTGSLPFDSERLRTAGFAEMRRIIRDEEPPTPSTRLGAAPAPRTTASARRLHGDLDAIVLQALAKDRERRYGSAAALATDVRRYLANEPVQAVRPTSLYYARKFVRKHRAGVAVASALAIVLLIGAIGTLTGFRQAHSNYGRALASIDRLLLRAHEAPVHEDPAALRLKRRLFAEAFASYDELLADGADVELQRKAARALYYQAGANDALGERDAALRLYRAAAERQRALVQAMPDDREARRELAMTLSDTIELQVHGGATDAAAAAYREAATLVDGLLATDPDDDATVRTAGNLRANRLFLLERNRVHEAEVAEVIAARQRLVELRPDDVEAAGWLGQARMNAGIVYLEGGRVTEAIDHLDGALPLLERWAAAAPEHSACRQNLALCKLVLGKALLLSERPELGAQLMTASIALYDELVATYPAVVDYRLRAAIARHQTADFARLPSETAVARLVERAISDLEYAIERDPDHEECRARLLLMLRQAARSERARAAGGDSVELERAEQRLRAFELGEAERLSRRAEQADVAGASRARDCWRAGELLLAMRGGNRDGEPTTTEVDRAERALRLGLAALEAPRSLGERHTRVMLLATLARARERKDDVAGARALLTEALTDAGALVHDHPEEKIARNARWEAAYRQAELLARLSDHRALATLAARLPEYGEFPVNGFVLTGEYFLRCLRALDTEPDLDDAERATLRAEYARRSVAGYRGAIEHGLRNLDFLRHEAFDVLRQRPDFREMLQLAGQR